MRKFELLLVSALLSVGVSRLLYLFPILFHYYLAFSLGGLFGIVVMSCCVIAGRSDAYLQVCSQECVSLATTDQQ